MSSVFSFHVFTSVFHDNSGSLSGQARVTAPPVVHQAQTETQGPRWSENLKPGRQRPRVTSKDQKTGQSVVGKQSWRRHRKANVERACGLTKGNVHRRETRTETSEQPLRRTNGSSSLPMRPDVYVCVSCNGLADLSWCSHRDRVLVSPDSPVAWMLKLSTLQERGPASYHQPFNETWPWRGCVLVSMVPGGLFRETGSSSSSWTLKWGGSKSLHRYESQRRPRVQEG